METVRNYFGKVKDDFVVAELEKIYILSDEERDYIISFNSEDATLSEFIKNKKNINYSCVENNDKKSFLTIVMMHSKKNGIICITRSFENTGKDILNGLRVLSGVAYAFHYKYCYKSDITFESMAAKINEVGLNALCILNPDRGMIIDSETGMSDINSIMML